MTLSDLITAGKTDAEILAIGAAPRPRDIDVVALRKIGLRTDVLDAIEQAAPSNAYARKAARLFSASGVDRITVNDPEWAVAAETIGALIQAGVISSEHAPAFQAAAYDLTPLYTQADIDRARREAAIADVRAEFTDIWNAGNDALDAYRDNGGNPPTLDELLAWRVQ